MDVISSTSSDAARPLFHNPPVDPRLSAIFDKCIVLDLETGPDGAVRKVGAVRDGCNPPPAPLTGTKMVRK